MKIIESSKKCLFVWGNFELIRKEVNCLVSILFHNDYTIPWLNQSNTCPLCRHKFSQEEKDELHVIFDGEIGRREFQKNFTVSTASTLTKVGEDDDLRKRDMDAMREEDGYIMILDS